MIEGDNRHGQRHKLLASQPNASPQYFPDIALGISCSKAFNVSSAYSFTNACNDSGACTPPHATA
jgi:hypothetical protein